MELWIRSQDRKRLIPNPNLFIVTNEDGISCVGDTTGHIAEYKSEKRALEILDEIQSVIEHDGTCYYNKKVDALYNLFGVYDMPKE